MKQALRTDQIPTPHEAETMGLRQLVKRGYLTAGEGLQWLLAREERNPRAIAWLKRRAANEPQSGKRKR